MNALFWIGIVLILYGVVRRLESTKYMQRLRQKRMRELVEHLKSFIPSNRGWTWAAPILFCLVCSLIAVSLAWPLKHAIVIEHDIMILKKTIDGDFSYQSREEPNGGSFRPCPEDKQGGVDVDDILTKGIGYIADYAIWEERGTCKSIL